MIISGCSGSLKFPPPEGRRASPSRSRISGSRACRAARIWSRDHLYLWVFMLRPPGCGVVVARPQVRLHEHAVDLLDVDGSDGIAHGLDERADGDVAGMAQHAAGGANDQRQRLLGKHVVPESGPL